MSEVVLGVLCPACSAQSSNPCRNQDRQLVHCLATFFKELFDEVLNFLRSDTRWPCLGIVVIARFHLSVTVTACVWDLRVVGIAL